MKRLCNSDYAAVGNIRPISTPPKLSYIFILLITSCFRPWHNNRSVAANIFRLTSQNFMSLFLIKDAPNISIFRIFTQTNSLHVLWMNWHACIGLSDSTLKFVVVDMTLGVVHQTEVHILILNLIAFFFCNSLHIKPKTYKYCRMIKHARSFNKKYRDYGLLLYIFLPYHNFTAIIERFMFFPSTDESKQNRTIFFISFEII